MTGTNLFAIVWRRMPAFNISGVTGFSSRTTSRDFVVDVGNLLDQIVVGLVDSIDLFSAGISVTS